MIFDLEMFAGKRRNLFGPTLLGLMSGIVLTAGSALAQPAVTAPPPTKQAYVDFAMSHAGDAALGRAVFNNQNTSVCARCHSTDGSSSLAGPDLFTIGGKFERGDLIRAVLEPSADIAIGYDTTTIQTKSGEDAEGIVKEVTSDWTELMSGDGKRVRIAASDIQSQRTSKVSLMPQGLEAGMSLDDFANLIAYLASLRQSTIGLAHRGMPENIPVATKGLGLELFFRGNIQLDHPDWFGEVPGKTNLFIVLEHYGNSWLIEKGAAADTQTKFVDLSGIVQVSGSSGLLGLAFHPKFRENRKYYLQYQITEGDRHSTMLVEREFAADFKGDSGKPSRVIMKIAAATSDHNGGCITFGPDGFLYIGIGDTGPQRDPQGHGQDLNMLAGKMLRIDVDHSENGQPYAIPANNPFRNHPNARPEIWAYGFREPWRFSFDPLTHNLWVGDVGQDSFEEIDIVRGGENYGWNVYEGFEPFSNRYRRAGEQFTPPVFSYSHRFGVSVTGGYLYRGSRAPAMQGWYICADFELRHIWALTQTNRALQKIVEIGRAPARAVSFAEDHDGELYLVCYDSGLVYRLKLESVNPIPLPK